VAKEFPLEPVEVEPIATKYRKLSGIIPDEHTIGEIEKLRKYEALSMRGQPPILWDRAEGINVFDTTGNKWLDFSSGVLITNAGHGRKEIVEAIVNQASRPMLTSYCFANEPRVKLVEKLISIAPEKLNKVFLMSTGSEATECALKLMRTYGRQTGGDTKSVIVSFQDAFHGRPMGAQQMGGMAGGKAWIKNLDPEIVHVPFPDGFRCEDTRFLLFEKTLDQLGIQPAQVAGVISETYQGVGPNLCPKPTPRRFENGAINMAPCSASTKSRPVLADAEPSGVLNTTASFPICFAWAKASAVPYPSAASSVAKRSWTFTAPTK